MNIEERTRKYYQVPIVLLVFGQMLVHISVPARVNDAAITKLRQVTCDFLSWQELPALACGKWKEQTALLSSEAN